MSHSQKKLVVRRLITDFRAAVEIETSAICMPEEGYVCIRNKYVGINADDINITKGREYFVDAEPPFACGTEGCGHVVAVGEGVKNIKVGDAVIYIDFLYHAFAEYSCVAAEDVERVPSVKPEYLVLCTSGISAIVGVDKFAKLKKGETFLITGASGGLGHLAVQIAKHIGCHVVATCSVKEKKKFLKDLGCNRIIVLKDEDLDKILSEEYPDGFDVIWETVGGSVFEICLHHISRKGRLVIMGATSDYLEENKEAFSKNQLSLLQQTLYYKGASVIGGNVDTLIEYWKEFFHKLLDLYDKGVIKPFYHTNDGKQEFMGMKGIIDAVEHLYRGKHTGKVIAAVY